MATSIASDTYLQQVYTTRTQLNVCFRRAHEILTGREADLIRQLDYIQTSYEKEMKSREEEVLDLEKSKQFLQTSLHDNNILNKSLAPLTNKIEQLIKQSSAVRTITFQWNSAFDLDLQLAGEIITTSTVPEPIIPHSNLTSSIHQSDLMPIIPQTSIPNSNLTPVILDYRNTSSPVISCCKQGTATGQLSKPCGLAVELQSGRIYIVDNGKIQVYTPNGEFCYMFSKNMNKPWGICINNNTVYISQISSYCVTLYKLDGEYLNKIGSEGTSKGKFKFPTGIAVSATSEHIYVCDTGNNRMQIFDKSLKFNSQFGNNFLNDPRDVKLSNDLVIILDEGNPCIHIFSITNCSLLNSIISRGTTGSYIADSYSSLFFTIDAELNIILTDKIYHCIKVFTKTGDFITQIGRRGHAIGEFTCPKGIAIDRQSRIIVVSINKNCSLQIF